MQFVRSLFIAIFGEKPGVAAIAVSPSVRVNGSMNINDTTPATGKSAKPIVQIIAVRKRRRLSAIIEVAGLPEVPAEILGKHHVFCRWRSESDEAKGHYKVLGQIGSNSFARIRRFGDGRAGQKMVRLSFGA